MGVAVAPELTGTLGDGSGVLDGVWVGTGVGLGLADAVWVGTGALTRAAGSTTLWGLVV